MTVNMSTSEYKYVPATHAKLRRCIKYLQNLYQLRDWEIKLDTSYKLPSDFAGDAPDEYNALANISADRLRATIWCPLKRHKEENENPYEALTHEMTHVLTERCGNKPEDELLVRIISPSIYRLMCADMGITLGDLK